MEPIGTIDHRAQASGPGAVTADAKTHGDIVVDAISLPTRLLMGGVITINLALGLWLIHRADFSHLRPQGDGVVAPDAAPAVDAAPHAGSSAERGLFALNERD